MQECRRTEQTCLFIRHSVLERHTIICVFKLVMLFLITLANKGQETMFIKASPRRRGTEHFSYNFSTYTDPFYSELMEEHKRNRVARPVLRPYKTWSTGTPTFNTNTHLRFLHKWLVLAIFIGNLPTKTIPTTKLT